MIILICPECNSKEISYAGKENEIFECDECQYEFTRQEAEWECE
jgi:transposase-like protein